MLAAMQGQPRGTLALHVAEHLVHRMLAGGGHPVGTVLEQERPDRRRDHVSERTDDQRQQQRRHVVVMPTPVAEGVRPEGQDEQADLRALIPLVRERQRAGHPV